MAAAHSLSGQARPPPAGASGPGRRARRALSECRSLSERAHDFAPTRKREDVCTLVTRRCASAPAICYLLSSLQRVWARSSVREHESQIRGDCELPVFYCFFFTQLTSVTQVSISSTLLRRGPPADNARRCLQLVRLELNSMSDSVFCHFPGTAPRRDRRQRTNLKWHYTRRTIV